LRNNHHFVGKLDSYFRIKVHIFGYYCKSVKKEKEVILVDLTIKRSHFHNLRIQNFYKKKRMTEIRNYLLFTKVIFLDLLLRNRLTGILASIAVDYMGRLDFM